MKDDPLGLYVCPQCKGTLQPGDSAIECHVCRRFYPIEHEIPNFLLYSLQESGSLFARNVSKFGKVARIYETRLWYPVILNLYGGWRSISFGELIAYAREKMLPVKGLLLDVATGTGTYGRRVAGEERTVYGIDLSVDMMRVGQAYVKREGVTHMYFSRADVESLPFANDLFDGCFTFGSLHLFPDTFKALSEIGRTLKPGAPLVVFTFTCGDRGILKYDWVRRHSAWGGLKIFNLPELQMTLDKAGFEHFDPELKGSILLFSARKKLTQVESVKP